jgi:hypothetical protein
METIKTRAAENFLFEHLFSAPKILKMKFVKLLRQFALDRMPYPMRHEFSFNNPNEKVDEL